MKKPILKYWYRVNDLMWDNEKYPSVTLQDKNAVEKRAGMGCEISPNGNVKISTHTEGSYNIEGKNVEEWILLLQEIKNVIDHYWGNR